MDSLTVYEIRPTQDGLNSMFVKLARLGIDQSTTLHNVRIKPHAVVVRCGPQFFVWDWSSNRGSKWISSTLFKPPVRAVSIPETESASYESMLTRSDRCPCWNGLYSPMMKTAPCTTGIYPLCSLYPLASPTSRTSQASKTNRSRFFTHRPCARTSPFIYVARQAISGIAKHSTPPCA